MVGYAFFLDPTLGDPMSISVLAAAALTVLLVGAVAIDRRTRRLTIDMHSITWRSGWTRRHVQSTHVGSVIHAGGVPTTTVQGSLLIILSADGHSVARVRADQLGEEGVQQAVAALTTVLQPAAKVWAYPQLDMERTHAAWPHALPWSWRKPKLGMALGFGIVAAAVVVAIPIVAALTLP